ncbi:MAG: right-handed parallel beta-helix repeat-containing protein, partial [Cyanobacteria bacterium J06641_5]
MTAFSATPYFGALLLVGLPLLAPAAAAQTEFWVDPDGGSDRIGNGRPAFPVKTISRALELVGPNTVIHLAAGTYGPGETFPLVLPPTVSLHGSPRERGSVTIRGGDFFDAAAAGINVGVASSQHAAVVATGAGSIHNLTISNPQGLGVWIIGNGNVSVRDNTFLDSQEVGLAIATAGTPVVQNNTFTGHRQRALSIEGSTRARIVANTFERNGTGIWVGGVAIPTLQSNRLQDNRIGIEIDGITRPTLQGNQIENS